jgi:putative membrane protein
MLFLRWLLNALILLMVSYIVPGIHFTNSWSLMLTVVIFGLINALIRPLVIILTLPINILTLGLLTLIINALMFWLTSSIVKGFEVENFWAAFWGALVYWLFVLLIDSLGKDNKVTKAKTLKH